MRSAETAWKPRDATFSPTDDGHREKRAVKKLFDMMQSRAIQASFEPGHRLTPGSPSRCRAQIRHAPPRRGLPAGAHGV